MPRLLFSLLFLLTFSIDRCASDPRATQAGLICTNRTAPVPQRQSFVSSFMASMDALSPEIAALRYANVTTGTGNSTVYAFGECMKDLSQADCDLCFAQCKTQILRCLPFQLGTRGGRLFFDGCYLRYDDYRFFAESLSSDDKPVCGSVEFGGNRTVFGKNVAELVRNLSSEAARNDGFFVGSVNRGNVSVYGLAQCWETVNRSGCVQCLNDAVSRIGSCPPNTEGRVLNAGCYFRYSTQKFYDNSTSASAGGNAGRRRLAVILAIVSSVVALVFTLATSVFCMKKKLLERRRMRKQLGALLSTVNKSNLNFSYETLEKATNYFHSSNKLGQGGSGSVYKGTLPDGKVVAIKRLFFNTTQWVDHFFNEVNLISGIDHKNLVKLLGCSITGPESLLVYEFVPNQSLNDHIIGKRDVRPLSWELRYNIILGTAEGLAYLHEESSETIIHRDIKLSNVLLEDDFTVKIADFGLARLLPEDQSHISTGIAGTLGYMAPEYVVRGKLTEKVDVYGFGVLVMEVVTGRRNNSFTQDSFSILQMVWNFYGSAKLPEAVDPALGGNFPPEDVSRVLQIGLLCVQATAELRPSMSNVVKMLTMKHEIPKPTQPPFLNHGSVEIRPYLSPKNYDSHESYSQSSGNNMTESLVHPR